MNRLARVLIAPDGFKGSLSAQRAAEALARGMKRALPDLQADLLPLSDGGEGFAETLLVAGGGAWVPAHVTGPLGEPLDSGFGLLEEGRVAVVEAAAACGLTLVPPERRDPRVTTSRGLGELLLAALTHAPRHILVGLGGSATNDGGTGLLRALGARFLDARGCDLPEGGAALARLTRINLDGWRWPADAPPLLVASDVTNPLCGPLGASAVYGPQKGASPEAIIELDAALARYARVTAETLGAAPADAPGVALAGYGYADAPGAGAAGGLGYAFLAWLHADLRPGVELALEAARFPQRAAACDLIVTGEGRLDAQTGMGKAILGVARAGKAAGKPVVALVGGIVEDSPGDLDGLREEGLLTAMSLAPGPMTLEALMRDAEPLLEAAAERMARWLTVP